MIHIASADRRPVDPPPVVELKIYEEGETKQDITFSYHANFFLYITLENARPIAHGRVPNSQATIPVLTGTPVAGMAYLDRPTPAGYFIFPDLSVRHEGKYRLSFNLYEEPKDAKDADVEPRPGSQESIKMLAPRNGANSLSPQSHIHFRLEVKSEPFTVFSAKKFPGLKESTAISRVVSEQGCRVRIRRDVRMRRRDPKTRGVYDEYEDENVYARSDRFITPESYKPQIPERPRSIGNGANEAAAPYHMEPHRPSMVDVPFYSQGSFQPHQPAAQPQNVNSGLGSHLAFGNSPTPNFIQANFHPPINQLPNQLSNPLQGSNDYHQYPATVRAGHYSSLPNGAYAQTQTPQHPPLAQNQISNPTPSNLPFPDSHGYTEFRQPPVSSSNNNQGYTLRNLDPYPSIETLHPAPSNFYPQSNPAPSTPTDHALPPLKSLETSFEKKYDLNASISTLSGAMVSSSPSFSGIMTPTSQLGGYNPVRSGKRRHDAVFDTGHIDEPLRGGMRPNPANHGQDIPQIEAEDGSLEDVDPRAGMKLLSYRRADGRQQIRKCPSPISE